MGSSIIPDGNGGVGLRGAVHLCHHFLRQRVCSGDLVVDATCGNGQDTLLLAELVGEKGKVWAFDIQDDALARTRDRLVSAGMELRVELVPAGHENLDSTVSGQLAAVVFNLGYLPAGDRSITTEAGTTVAALEQAAGLLRSGGVLLIAVYTRHDSGEEWGAVRQWAAALHPHEFNVWQARQLNRSDAAPFLVIVERGEDVR